MADQNFEAGIMTSSASPRAVLPRFVGFLVLLGGSWTAVPFMTSAFPRAMRLGFLLAGLPPYLLLALSPVWWIPLAGFLAWNFPFFLYLTARHSAPRPKGSHRRLDTARIAVALTLAGAPFGVMWSALEQWLADALWSQYYPVNASLDGISTGLGLVWSTLVVLLFFSSLKLAKRGRAPSLPVFASFCLLVFCTHLVLYQLFLITVVIPLWQVESLELFPAWFESVRLSLFLLLWLLVIPSIVSLFRNGSDEPLSFRRFAPGYFRGLAGLIPAMAGLALFTGTPVSYALLLGQHFEKQGITAWSVPFYSQALEWTDSPSLQSYLQFRVGLLHRKNGRMQEAREAFVTMLVKYNRQSQLLLEAHDFKDRLQSAEEGHRRVVIPGIEAKTEYKSAYCVPNSLGLILNYWGDRAGAKKIGAEITHLEEGSLMTDEVFYAESRGFRNLVIPLRSLTDIFRLIDAGIPVLTFIPGHVLAVFGYDEVLQTLVTYDVNTYDIWDDQRWTRFSEEWSRLYNTLAVVVPDSRYDEVLEILGGEVESQSEAYLQYLFAHTSGKNLRQVIEHLGRATDKGLHFPDWEYQYWTGIASTESRRDASMSDFLVKHPVYESQMLEYLRNLYQRGEYARAVSFIRLYGRERRLSGGMATLLAGCLLRLDRREEALETMLYRIDSDELDALSLDFLLRQPEIQGNPQVARGLALKMLGLQDGLPAASASLAYWTWRRNTFIDNRNIDEALIIAEDYLTFQNPFDKPALADFLEFFPLKLFRSDDEWSRKTWDKKMAAFASRLSVLDEARQ